MTFKAGDKVKFLSKQRANNHSFNFKEVYTIVEEDGWMGLGLYVHNHNNPTLLKKSCNKYYAVLGYEQDLVKVSPVRRNTIKVRLP